MLLNLPEDRCMARAGVTYADVLAAAEEINSHGKTPTVDRVREHLGTGSKSTIAPLLKQWRHAHTNKVQIGGLPNDLVEVVKSLYERVQREADSRIGIAKETFDSELEKLRAELKDKCNVITELSSTQKQLEAQVENLSMEKTEIKQFLEDARVSLAKSETQREDAHKRIDEMKKNEIELREESRNIRSHFEHYQQKTAESSQREREHFLSTEQQLRAQIEGLNGQCIKAEDQVSKLQALNEGLILERDQSKDSQLTLQLDIAKKDEQLSNLTQELQTAENERRAIKQQYECLQEEKNVLNKEHTATTTQLVTSEESLKNVLIELALVKEKVDSMQDQNILLIEEKAVIQGQFKQLQNSL